jgi:hypothetical protein
MTLANSPVSMSLGWSKFLRGGALAWMEMGREKRRKSKIPKVKRHDLHFSISTPLQILIAK